MFFFPIWFSFLKIGGKTGKRSVKRLWKKQIEACSGAEKRAAQSDRECPPADVPRVFGEERGRADRRGEFADYNKGGAGI